VHTLVLGAGGPVGGAWLAGVADRLVREGLPLREAKQILGTSSGAVVGAWVGSGAELDAFGEVLIERLGQHTRRELERSTAEDLEHAAVDALWPRCLPGRDWPHALRVAAVAADTGRLGAWGADDGVALATAVAVSTAAPGVTPPVRISGRLYMDAAVRSPTNADAAATRIDDEGAEVIVLAPAGGPGLHREMQLLRRLGCVVTVVRPGPEDLRSAFGRPSAAYVDPQLVDLAIRAGHRAAERALAHLPYPQNTGRFG
jgi:NTE family protein